MRIFKDCDSFSEPRWVIFDGCHAYFHKYFLGVCWQYICEYRDDKHLMM